MQMQDAGREQQLARGRATNARATRSAAWLAASVVAAVAGRNARATDSSERWPRPMPRSLRSQTPTPLSHQPVLHLVQPRVRPGQ